MAGSKGPEDLGSTGRAFDPLHDQSTKGKPKTSPRTKYEHEDDSFPPKWPDSDLFQIPAAAAVPRRHLFSWRNIIGVTMTLYILNQAHCLPKPVGSIVSKVLFWPSLPITVLRRYGNWATEIDDTVVLGGAPFGFVDIPERLYRDFGVRGVINMCDEYEGPIKKYNKLGMDHIRLRTVDHFNPSLDDLKTAVAFIQEQEAQGNRVYVHCRAGHGRSAAAVFCWLLCKDPKADPEELNKELLNLRAVRKTLWKQPNIIEFHSWLKSGGVVGERHKRKYPNFKKILGFDHGKRYPAEDMKDYTVEEVSSSDEGDKSIVDGLRQNFNGIDSDEDTLDNQIGFVRDESSSEDEYNYQDLWNNYNDRD